MEAEMKEMDENLGKNAFSEDDNFDEWSQSKLEKREQQKHTKRKMNEDIETIEKLRIVR